MVVRSIIAVCTDMNDVRIMGPWLILISCARQLVPQCGSARRDIQMQCGQSQEQSASRENVKAPIFVLPVMFIGVQDAAFAQQQANPCKGGQKTRGHWGFAGDSSTYY